MIYADVSNIFELFLPVTQDIVDVFCYKKKNSSTLNRVTFYSQNNAASGRLFETPAPDIAAKLCAFSTASWLLWLWIFSALVNQSWWWERLKPSIINTPDPTLLSENNNVVVHAGRQGVGRGRISLPWHTYRLFRVPLRKLLPCVVIPSPLPRDPHDNF